MNMKTEKQLKNSTKELITAGLFAALVCIGAYIRIPFLFVPLTAQFLFVNLAILYQSRRFALLSIFTYIFLGLIGLPVFANGGGIGYLLKPTFGYIVGFLLAAGITGTIKDKLPRSLKIHLLLSGINIMIIYICGLIYFYLISNVYLGSSITISKLFVVGCLIFIPGDILSGVISSLLAERLRRYERGGFI